MKNKLLFLPLFLLSSLSSCEMLDDTNLIYSDYAFSDEFQTGNTTISNIDDVSCLHISWLKGDISLKTTTESSIVIKEVNQNSNEQNQIKTLIKNSVLYVEYCAPGIHVGQDYEKALVVEIPETFRFYNITIQTFSSSVTSNVSADEFYVYNTNGDIDFKSTSSDIFHVETYYGNVKCESDYIDDLFYQSKTGNLDVKLKDFLLVDFNTDFGNFEIDGIDSEVSFIVNFKSSKSTPTINRESVEIRPNEYLVGNDPETHKYVKGCANEGSFIVN